MSAGRLDGIERLYSSGFGVILGGIALAAFAIAFPYGTAAVATFGLGVVGWIIERRRGGVHEVAIGVVAVGAIALVEALSAFGFGIGPFALAALAVVFGAFDIVASRVLDRLRGR